MKELLFTIEGILKSKACTHNTNTNINYPDVLTVQNWGKKERKLKKKKALKKHLNSIMERDRCFQEQNSGKNLVKIHIIFCRATAVRGQSKIVFPIYKTRIYQAEKEKLYAEKLEV